MNERERYLSLSELEAPVGLFGAPQKHLEELDVLLVVYQGL